SCHRASRLRQYRFVARAAAASDRTATAVEQAQGDAVAGKYLDQCDLRLVEFPVGGEEAAGLVAVRITEHHFLHVAPAREQLPILGQGKKLVHDRAATAQIGDGLEQRDDVDCE